MESVFTIAVIATLCFCGLKFAEMRLLNKNKPMKPLKYFIRDAILVFLSAAIAAFAHIHLGDSIHSFMNTVTETKVLNTANTEVFTDTPGF